MAKGMARLFERYVAFRTTYGFWNGLRLLDRLAANYLLAAVVAIRNTAVLIAGNQGQRE